MTEIAARLARPVHRLGLASAVAIALAFVLVALGTVVLVRGIMFRDAVLPGTHVAGVDVGGLSPAEAEARISAELGARLARPVTVTLAGETVTAQPDRLFALDAPATSEAAFNSARQSLQAGLAALSVPFIVKRDVAPVLDLRAAAHAALSAELGALLDEPRSARLELHGSTPVVTPAANGEGIDQASLLEAIKVAALEETGVAQAQILSVDPAITTAEAEAVAVDARAALSSPVLLKVRRKSIGEI